MYRTLFLYLFLLAPGILFSQPDYTSQYRERIDSLKKLLPGTNEENRFNLLNQLAACYAPLSFDTSLGYANQALLLAEEQSNALAVARVKVNIGNACYYTMDFRNAVLYYLSAINVLEYGKSWNELGEIHLQLGYINFYRLRSDEAFAYYRKAIWYYELSGNETSLSLAWEALSLAISFLSNWPIDSSLVYGYKLLDYARNKHDLSLEAKALMEIGMFYSCEGGSVPRKQQAILYSDTALNLARELDNEELISIIFINLGHYYDRSSLLFEYTGDLSLSRFNYEQACNAAHKAGDNILQVISLNSLAIIDIEENKFHQASTHLDSAEARLRDYFRFDYKRNVVPTKSDYFRENPFNYFLALRERNNVFNSRYKLAMAKGYFRDAMEFRDLYYQSRDSMNSAQQGRQIEMLMAEAEAERRDQEIRTLSQEKELQRLKLSRTRYMFIGAGAGVVIISLFLLLWFQRKRWKAEQKSITLEQKLLRSQMNPHFIFNSLASIQNFIVNHKANEASISLSRFSQLIRNILDNSTEEYVPLKKEIETIRHYLELQQVRYAGQFTYSLSMDEKIDEESMMIPPMLAQPFIENSIEHGIRYKETPGHIDISFRLEDNMIRFGVEDDGVGREKARQIELQQNRGHRSLSTSITHDRLINLNKKLKTKIRMEITDLKNPLGEACGTRVTFGIPVVER